VSVFRLNSTIAFPPPELADASGLLAVGGDLSVERLLQAYARGIFPWFGPGNPLLWWSPDPRTVILPAEFHPSRRLARRLRQGRFRITADTDFAAVIRACAAIPRRHEAGTWITPAMEAAYRRLHEAGFAHSVEVYTTDDRLAGGLYGVSLGGCFCGESMFSRVTDASKAALAVLVEVLTDLNFDFIDCQFLTAHLKRLGAREISRKEYLARLDRALKQTTRRGPWTALFSERKSFPG
jgi:leucyl/phenylalanyl-tRNA--protein transferase